MKKDKVVSMILAFMYLCKFQKNLKKESLERAFIYKIVYKYLKISKQALAYVFMSLGVKTFVYVNPGMKKQ